MTRDCSSKESWVVAATARVSVRLYSVFIVTPGFTSTIADNIKYLTLIDSSKIWMPDTFFRNEKIGSFHNILAPNLYVRIFPNGDVLYSIR